MQILKYFIKKKTTTTNKNTTYLNWADGCRKKKEKRWPDEKGGVEEWKGYIWQGMRHRSVRERGRRERRTERAAWNAWQHEMFGSLMQDQ